MLDEFEQDIYGNIFDEIELIERAKLSWESANKYFQNLSTQSENLGEEIIGVLTAMGCEVIVSSMEIGYVTVVLAGVTYVIYWGDKSSVVVQNTNAVIINSLCDGLKRVFLDKLLEIMVRTVDLICFNPIKYQRVKNKLYALDQ